ncbi:MAG: hypothetical protein EOO59_04685 [Hymenobacter sp.]|nr:MAG: hypothetical protein EOO59_04685 [Hymenobacter sp.]
MKILLTALLLASGLGRGAAAQVAVTYFPFQSVLAISSDTERRGWGSLNVDTNTFISNTTLEVQGLVALRQGRLVNYYTGLGLNVSPFYVLNGLTLVNGYTLTLGARIKPLPARPQAQLVFELAPYVSTYGDSGTLRTRLGLAYNFGPARPRP